LVFLFSRPPLQVDSGAGRNPSGNDGFSRKSGTRALRQCGADKHASVGFVWRPWSVLAPSQSPSGTSRTPMRDMVSPILITCQVIAGSGTSGVAGGSNGKGLTYVNPLRTVLDVLKVDLAGIEYV